MTSEVVYVIRNKQQPDQFLGPGTPKHWGHRAHANIFSTLGAARAYIGRYMRKEGEWFGRYQVYPELAVRLANLVADAEAVEYVRTYTEVCTHPLTAPSKARKEARHE